MVPNFVIEVKLEGVIARTVSVPVVTSALVAISITPGLVADAASAVIVTAPVAADTSIPPPATILVTFAAVYVVLISVPCQVPVPIVPRVVRLVLPAQVERAVFSTLPNPTSPFVVDCALKFG